MVCNQFFGWVHVCKQHQPRLQNLSLVHKKKKHKYSQGYLLKNSKLSSFSLLWNRSCFFNFYEILDEWTQLKKHLPMNPFFGFQLLLLLLIYLIYAIYSKICLYKLLFNVIYLSYISTQEICCWECVLVLTGFPEELDQARTDELCIFIQLPGSNCLHSIRKYLPTNQ